MSVEAQKKSQEQSRQTQLYVKILLVLLGLGLVAHVGLNVEKSLEENSDTAARELSKSQAEKAAGSAAPCAHIEKYLSDTTPARGMHILCFRDTRLSKGGNILMTIVAYLGNSFVLKFFAHSSSFVLKQMLYQPSTPNPTPYSYPLILLTCIDGHINNRREVHLDAPGADFTAFRAELQKQLGLSKDTVVALHILSKRFLRNTLLKARPLRGR